MAKAIIKAGWSHVPHLDEKTKQELLSAYPEHERKARTEGEPVLGSGLVLPVDPDVFTVEPFHLPASWPRICGIDFGWDHPAAAAWLAWDRDSDCLYLFDCWRMRETTPSSQAPHIIGKGKWIPVAWPHDGLQHDKGSGEQIAEQYRAQGVRMLSDRATFTDGTNGLEAGVIDMLGRMQTGRLKVAAHLTEWLEEFRGYHRKDGLIVKRRDDLLSATRYALMMLRFAETEPDHDDEAPRHRLSGGADFDPFKW